MLYIDAWLDRTNPYIRIIDQDSGEVITEFEGEEVHECLERGDICVQDLYCSTPRTQHEVVKHLLLTRCGKSLMEQINTCAHQCQYYGKKAANLMVLPSNVLPLLLVPLKN